MVLKKLVSGDIKFGETALMRRQIVSTREISVGAISFGGENWKYAQEILLATICYVLPTKGFIAKPFLRQNKWFRRKKIGFPRTAYGDECYFVATNLAIAKYILGQIWISSKKTLVITRFARVPISSLFSPLLSLALGALSGWRSHDTVSSARSFSRHSLPGNLSLAISPSVWQRHLSPAHILYVSSLSLR